MPVAMRAVETRASRIVFAPHPANGGYRVTERKTCSHLSEIETVRQSTKHVCEECIKTGDSWVHLRVCQTCGKTLCCDSSPNRHATKHAKASGHPVIASAEPGERWLYCYVDELLTKY